MKIMLDTNLAAKNTNMRIVNTKKSRNYFESVYT